MRKITPLAAIICAAFIFQQGCTKKESEDLTVFRGVEKDDVRTWDPVNSYDSVSSDLVPNIYETLYQYTYLSEGYDVEPLLAAGMPKYSKDHLTVTIPIKRGVKFQNDPCFKATHGKGRELKAQDFVYGIKRLALPSLQSQGWWIIDDELVGMNAFHEKLLKASKEELPRVFDDEVEGLRAVDDYTLQLKLTRHYPVLKYVLTMSFTSPVPREAVKAYSDDKGNISDHPVGTGPFVLKKWVRNHRIVLDRNVEFRKEPYPSKASLIYHQTGLLADSGRPMPLVDQLIVEVIKEDQPRWLNFMKGNTDVIRLPKDNFKEAIAGQVNLAPEQVKKGIHLSIENGVVIRYFSFNMRDNLLGPNKYLRQAISSAIDREKWISVFTNGTGKKMVNAIPPKIADRPKTSRIKYDFNLAGARLLLKKAGFPDGQGLSTIKFDLRGASATDRQIGDFVTQQLAQIGIKVEVVPNTFPAYLEKQKQGNLQMFYGGWVMDYPDAENIYQLLYGPNQSPGSGDSNFNDSEFNGLYEQMAAMESGSRRAEIIQKMDDILQESCPWVLGYYEADYFLSQPWLLNYRGTSIILNKFKYYHINGSIKNRYQQIR